MKNWFAAVLIITIGCRHKTDKQQYIDYVNNPKYKITQQIKIGEVVATVKLLPAEYRRLKNKFIDKDSEESNNDHYYFFDVRFDNTKNDKLSKEKLMYMDFDIQNDFVLLGGRDSIMPAICQKIENGSAGSNQYMLVFEKKNQPVQQDLAVIYKDKIFGIGTLAFIYKQNDIQRIPKLKLEESK